MAHSKFGAQSSYLDPPQLKDIDDAADVMACFHSFNMRSDAPNQPRPAISSCDMEYDDDMLDQVDKMEVDDTPFTNSIQGFKGTTAADAPATCENNGSTESSNTVAAHGTALGPAPGPSDANKSGGNSQTVAPEQEESLDAQMARIEERKKLLVTNPSSLDPEERALMLQSECLANWLDALYDKYSNGAGSK